ncbi:hypothetical protein HL658_04275 [Azospirillum sp. RWY-5-1]|uniref:CO dehydrogenase flavoprotein C-terminal domain-containing protein n=1 Tax=Azospirillum oleiclasticum TaxID=2735135 RepID=A0ABX2T432_9PROT|nr:hypothetical protein [Azospirillum oleiclasticum]NYZ11756.1 hypothetical protein [Azospirillum oleiclasticum]NYZ18916.1 hypothetical protein [Azospirillum oleiclasticum]
MITAIELPPNGFAAHSIYLKTRDRASYPFALVSVAAALEIADGTIREARLPLGGVAHKHWRDPEAEALLVGKPPTAESFRAAAKQFLLDARGCEHNAFTIDLAENAIVRAHGRGYRRERAMIATPCVPDVLYSPGSTTGSAAS